MAEPSAPPPPYDETESEDVEMPSPQRAPVPAFARVIAEDQFITPVKPTEPKVESDSKLATDTAELLEATRTHPAFRKDGRVRCVVWDFDLTLLKIHAFALRVTPEDVKFGRRRVAEDFRDLDFFRALVDVLISNGVQVAIASFGNYYVIQEYMNAAVGAGKFTETNISTPRCIGWQDGCSIKQGKVPQLMDLCSRLMVEPSTMIFFDDDERNVRTAEPDGFLCFHTPEAFTPAVWRAAVRKVGSA